MIAGITDWIPCLHQFAMRVERSARFRGPRHWDQQGRWKMFEELKVERIYHVLDETGARAQLDIVSSIEGVHHQNVCIDRLSTAVRLRGSPWNDLRMV